MQDLRSWSGWVGALEEGVVGRREYDTLVLINYESDGKTEEAMMEIYKLVIAAVGYGYRPLGCLRNRGGDDSAQREQQLGSQLVSWCVNGNF